MAFDHLATALDELSREGPVAVSFYDYQTGQAWSREGGRWFHSASTIKIAVLAALYAELERRSLTPWHRLHIRNRFFSAADGLAYRVPAARDANADVHAEVGRSMHIGDLAKHMIATSSNLATNLLADFVGAARIRSLLTGAGVQGVDFQRGVEDERAFEAGVINRVTADGLVALLKAIYEGRFGGAGATAAMIAALAAQEFNSGIPAGLPDAVRAAAQVAHKTGEISTVSHDAGLVFLPGRPPYALAILTEHQPERGQRFEPIARISSIVYDALAEAGAHARPADA